MRKFFHWLRMITTGIVYSKKGLKVYRNGWVVISDGKSKDMLPLNLVSQELIDEIETYLMKLGY